MSNMRAIRTRIRSVTNTQQITKAMKMVAVSKLRKVQGTMQSMRPFCKANQKLMDELLCSGEGEDNEFIAAKDSVNRVCYVLMVGNRGLCGMYNSSILKYMEEIAAKETRDYEVIVCGRWGKDVIRKSGLKVSQYLDELNDAPNETEGLELAEKLKRMYRDGEVGEVHLVYQEFVSALKQVPVCKQLLPLVPERSGEEAGMRQIDFEPDRARVLDAVVQLYINNVVFSAMLEARCGEHSSRMTAMTSATDSTKELLAQLSLSLNRARQAAITTEISEIVGGANALKKNKE